MRNTHVTSSRTKTLRTIAMCAFAALFVKVFASVLYEYRWYFPPNFEQSAFLSGRRYTFVGLYPAAFYTHIIGGPIAILIGVALVITGGRPRWSSLHRIAGRIQMLIALLVVAPSGIVMATQSYTGPIAGVGFATLATLTGSTAAAAWYFAQRGNYCQHQLWATRCFTLLASVLLLRIISGAAIVLHFDSPSFYRVNAWCSWLIPLVFNELRRSPTRNANQAAAETLQR